MNKQELISKLSEAAGFSKKDSTMFLDAFVEVVEDTVASGTPVKLVGFGNFEKKPTKGTSGTIQFGERKGEKWETQDSFKVSFSCGKEFADKVKV